MSLVKYLACTLLFVLAHSASAETIKMSELKIKDVIDGYIYIDADLDTQFFNDIDKNGRDAF